MYAVSLYTAGMRAQVLLALLAGCSFQVSATGDDGPGDGGADGARDGSPDSSGPLPACMTSPAYTSGPAAGHRYRKTDVRDRDSAVDACTADGAHLAVVETAEEDAFVRSIGGAGTFWIGLDDLKTEGAFRWVTGGAVTYERFEGAEPNDSGVEDCVMVNADGTWNDTDCGESRAAVCECETGYTPPPTPACRAMPAAVHAGRKYLLNKGGAAKSWPAAKAACELIGAHLPVFADREEEGPVNNDFPGDNWLGLSDIDTEGMFVWVDGSKPQGGTIHWNIVSPHNGDTNRNCVRIFSDWQDDPCSIRKEYARERERPALGD